MVRTTLRTFLVALALAAACQIETSANRQARAETYDLFYNHYVGPPGAPAQLYISPRPTPPLVGHTWITYQPLMPHEFLYKHHRTYYRYYPHGGFTTTSVNWH